MPDDCPYSCKAREEIRGMKSDIARIAEYSENNAFKPWIRGLLVAILGALFLLSYNQQISLNRDYIPRSESREDMADIKAELLRLNTKIDRLISDNKGMK